MSAPRDSGEHVGMPKRPQWPWNMRQCWLWLSTMKPLQSPFEAL
ncbi:hypothetical protein [Acidithiobacillus acidisediminis]|nr:hypothetical protein [Acidithiobacillus sp. S30A2]